MLLLQVAAPVAAAPAVAAAPVTAALKQVLVLRPTASLVTNLQDYFEMLFYLVGIQPTLGRVT